MEQYISKSALVAEIERRRDYYKRNPLLVNAKYCIDEDNAILKLLDTLEVKEVDLEKRQEEDVDLEKEVNQYYEKTWPFEEVDEDIIAFARHFFELGLKAQSKEMQEALRMEYEKGRADTIKEFQDALVNHQGHTTKDYKEKDINLKHLYESK